MRVIKVLNNSLVLALNDEGQEIILMGKGIGFQKTIGYKLSPKEIDKVFVLKDRELSRRIIRLAAETDSIYFEMAKSVIDYAVENYHMKLMDHIYLALTDHLAFAAVHEVVSNDRLVIDDGINALVVEFDERLVGVVVLFDVSAFNRAGLCSACCADLCTDSFAD